MRKPRTNILNDNQLEFCRLVALNIGLQKAYQVAYNNKNASSSAAGANRLMNLPEVKKEIARLRNMARKIVEKARQHAENKVQITNVMDRLERMQVLSQIGRGEIPLKKYIVCDGEIQEKDVVPEWMDRRAAIAELNKMDGNYAPEKSEVNLVQQLLTNDPLLNDTSNDSSKEDIKA